MDKSYRALVLLNSLVFYLTVSLLLKIILDLLHLILLKNLEFYESDLIVKNCFFSFILPHFEYCALVWSSAAVTNLRLLERSFSTIKFLIPNYNTNLDHHRNVGSLSLFFKILNWENHPFQSKLLLPVRPQHITRHSLNQNIRSLMISTIEDKRT